MDKNTIDHFEVWFSRHFNTRLTGREYLKLKAAMIATFDGDPEYWAEAGWPRVYEATRDSLNDAEPLICEGGDPGRPHRPDARMSGRRWTAPRAGDAFMIRARSDSGGWPVIRVCSRRGRVMVVQDCGRDGLPAVDGIGPLKPREFRDDADWRRLRRHWKRWIS